LKNSSSILQFLGFLTALSVINGLASLVGIVVFVSYFFALGEKRQTLYDLICNTTVFHVEDIISDNQTNNNNF
jgi:4-hydroxybenzoate polyprenyltransferase